MDIHVYTLEGKNRSEIPPEADGFATEDYEEAKGRARECGLMVIDNTYEWADSEMIDDFTDTEPCDECGADIPVSHPNMLNEHHRESCSLHPSNTV